MTTKILVFIIIASLTINYILVKSDNSLKVMFLDVGQGDAALIKTPNNKYILIDVGKDSETMSIIGERLPFFVREISLFIVSHPHEDHVGGVFSLFGHYGVGQIVWSKVDYLNSNYSYLLEREKSKQNEFLDVRKDQCVIYDFIDICFIVSPFLKEEKARVDFSGKEKININNYSLLVVIKYEGLYVVFMGDAELEEIEDTKENLREILAKIGFFGSGGEKFVILKASHHCSRTGMSEDFLDFINPNVVICSLGTNNKFGHPHSEVLELVKRKGATLYRTDENGTVEVILDNGNLQLIPEIN